MSENHGKKETLPERTWICVYRDVLGQVEDRDNLTDICVPTDWLTAALKEEGILPREWVDEYTADDTQELAWKAMAEGVILDCSDPELRSRWRANGVITKTEKTALSAAIRKAETHGGKTEACGMSSERNLEPER